MIDDETFLPLGRLNLTAIVDNYTQGILDIGDEFANESSSTVALSSKGNLAERSTSEGLPRGKKEMGLLRSSGDSALGQCDALSL